MSQDPKRDQVVRILRAIRRIMRSVEYSGRQIEVQFGVSGPQLACLTVLFEEGTLSIQQLGQRVFLSSGTLTGIIDRLELKAYVNRVRSQSDRRKIMLELTEAGRTLVERAPHPLQLRLIEGLQKRAPEANEALCSQLQQLVEMLEAENVGAEPVLDTLDSSAEPQVEEDELPPERGTQRIFTN